MTTEQKETDTSHVQCPYCKRKIVIMQSLPKAITLEEFRKRVRADLDADKARRKAARKAKT